MSGALVGWGLLGTGTVCNWFAPELVKTGGCELVAVGGRREAAVDGFAERHGAQRGYLSYQEVIDDPDVDVVYVGVPHPFHARWALAAIRAGKAVLCEKPFAMNRTEAHEVVGAAREAGVFLMEAMRARFVPSIVAARALIGAGEIGDVRLAHLDFGSVPPTADPEGRWLNPHLGGGALLDMGVYAMSLAVHLMGEPREVRALATIGPTGVDTATAVVLGFPDGGHALISTSFDADRPGGATIVGTRGRIELEGPLLCPTAARHIDATGTAADLPIVAFHDSMRFEIDEVVRCVGAGLTQSDVMPLTDSVLLAGLLDDVRALIGLRYPGEAS